MSNILNDSQFTINLGNDNDETLIWVPTMISITFRVLCWRLINIVLNVSDIGDNDGIGFGCFRRRFSSQNVGSSLSSMTTEPFSAVGPKCVSKAAAQFPSLY
jgi:hypothetical protein